MAMRIKLLMMIKLRLSLLSSWHLAHRTVFARIGVDVAIKGKRNKEIMKKSLEANSDACAYVLEKWCVPTHQSRCVRT
ncbi:hypothetical protein PIB30_077691 [Stylosanthes scabra]|uniref:Secreted protein n=1 Tax=Stylosanthes scabra TaxID=79078 RepID=A0ABU6UPI4_9FABA|nr:hypothetical protein [Stylosanthes scabra]